MQIKIKDNQEPLVDVRKYCPGVIVALGKKRMEVEKTAYLRKTVAKMLKKAQGFLPKGVNFVINDAWRPAYIQTEIYYFRA
jgi:D-alanyl-D-alanine dipeptidase